MHGSNPGSANRELGIEEFKLLEWGIDEYVFFLPARALSRKRHGKVCNIGLW